MELLLSLISSSPYIALPHDWLGWAGWLIFLAAVLYLNFRWRGYNKPLKGRKTILLLLLVAASVLTSLFIGFRLPVGSALPLPGVPFESRGAAVMFFSAVPLMLAAGFLGPASASALALFSGLLTNLWDSHNAFFPLQLALLAVLFAAALNQRYRTRSYQFLRRPLGASLLVIVLYPILLLISIVLSATGTLVGRLDYALTHLAAMTLAFGIPVLLGAAISEIVSAALPKQWGMNTRLVPSPAEKSLRNRFLYGMAPLAFLLVLTLMVGDWIIAGRAAREMLRDQMVNAAGIVANNVPYFLQTGQNLISELADDERLYINSPTSLGAVLQQDLRRVPYFTQLYLLDQTGSMLSSYPPSTYDEVNTPSEEMMGIQLALEGVPVQSYSIPPVESGEAAQVTFIASIQNPTGIVEGILIGRSDLASNPLTQPLLVSLDNLAGIDGQGMLVDEDGRILYHPDSSLIMTHYSGEIGQEPLFYDGTAPDGTRQLIYVQSVAGEPWAVIFTIPASRAQQLALEIATPLLAMIVILSIVGVVILQFGLQMVTASLKNLSLEAGRISQGQLDHPLQVAGEDEVGQLRRSFEGMRQSLKARLDELNQLLEVSQGVASSLEFQEAVKPVLEAALTTGACSVRVVLTPAAIPELDGNSPSPISYGAGPSAQAYTAVDEQILGLSRQQDLLVLTNPARLRLLNFPSVMPRPSALTAISLRHENLYYGTLWAVYDRPHPFPQEEIRFLVTLAGQAALAAANNRLFLTAEIGRQRLAAILSSTPDPVLVTDQHNNLLLANPAAWQVLDLGVDTDEGRPVEAVIPQPELVALLRTSDVEQQSAEINLPDERVYLAIASSVMAEGQRVGRVCLLRDVTHFKELDALKSEFVHTVSHDLRSPLTLMRGYATMLEMVGELNEQQVGYVRKIISGVESMSRLVNNLLDLGRIEAGVGLELDVAPITEIIDKVVSGLQPTATQKRIQIEVESQQPNLPPVEADQALLQQAIHNLIENAIKYTRTEGNVKISLQARQDRMVMEISDNGIGISPMDQPRLFERFYRGAQVGSKDQRGTGLGLAIVKSIAERHGGRVWVESQLGKGSTFYLSIPLKQNSR